MKKIKKSEKEWKEVLNDEECRVLKKKGTELAFSGKYVSETKEGFYTCAACGNTLFTSDSKFDSGCGWPSFSKGIKDSFELKPDNSLLMKRTEVVCSRCGSHLGHVFDDGPKPSGKRFCINSVSLKLNNKK